jgi:hypothetical protein
MPLSLLSPLTTLCPFCAQHAENRGTEESRSGQRIRHFSPAQRQLEGTPANSPQAAEVGWGTRGPRFKSGRPDSNPLGRGAQ